jgi:hypothetical protein
MGELGPRRIHSPLRLINVPLQRQFLRPTGTQGGDALCAMRHRDARFLQRVPQGAGAKHAAGHPGNTSLRLSPLNGRASPAAGRGGRRPRCIDAHMIP